MLLNPLTFHTPKSVSELLELHKNLTNVRLQAGGTFLLNSLKLQKRKGTKTPENIISLYKINELKGIKSTGKELSIGSMTTIADIYDSPFLKDNASILKLVCKNISTQPIRNMATIGGNLTCRYTWTEMPAVMIALNAQLHFIDTNDQPEILNAEIFFQNNAKTEKILTHITIPLDSKLRIAYQRVKKTMYVDIPMLSICITAHITNGKISQPRVSINNCVTFAQRDKKLEEFLEEKEAQTDLIPAALQHLDTTIYDTRSSEYKQHMFRVSMKKALLDLVSLQGA